MPEFPPFDLSNQDLPSELCQNPQVTKALDDFFFWLIERRSIAPTYSPKDTLDVVETSYLKNRLAKCGGQVNNTVVLQELEKYSTVLNVYERMHPESKSTVKHYVEMTKSKLTLGKMCSDLVRRMKEKNNAAL